MLTGKQAKALATIFSSAVPMSAQDVAVANKWRNVYDSGHGPIRALRVMGLIEAVAKDEYFRLVYRITPEGAKMVRDIAGNQNEPTTDDLVELWRYANLHAALVYGEWVDPNCTYDGDDVPPAPSNREIVTAVTAYFKSVG